MVASYCPETKGRHLFHICTTKGLFFYLTHFSIYNTYLGESQCYAWSILIIYPKAKRKKCPRGKCNFSSDSKLEILLNNYLFNPILSLFYLHSSLSRSHSYQICKILGSSRDYNTYFWVMKVWGMCWRCYAKVVFITPFRLVVLTNWISFVIALARGLLRIHLSHF